MLPGELMQPGFNVFRTSLHPQGLAALTENFEEWANVLRLPQGRLSMFTTLTTFGTPRDITLDELSVELFYPNDDASDALLHSLHAALPA